MKGAQIPRADLREVLEDLSSHLTADDGVIAAGPGAAPVLRRLFALAGLQLVRVSDGREPHLEKAA